MKTLLKKIVKKFFPALVDYRNRLYNDRAHRRFKHLEVKEVFETIFKENHWNDGESISGTGSNLHNTGNTIRILEEVIQTYQVKSILDIPCGDFNWMQKVDLKGAEYTGADIVEELITQNRLRHSSAKRNFIWADLTQSELPPVDLIFCRDCLVHLSFDHIRLALANIKRSGSKYLLTTTFPGHTNWDITTGNWRPLNLQAQPFAFVEPLALINESSMEDPRHADKALGLWEIAKLQV